MGSQRHSKALDRYPTGLSPLFLWNIMDQEWFNSLTPDAQERALGIMAQLVAGKIEIITMPDGTGVIVDGPNA